MYYVITLAALAIAALVGLIPMDRHSKVVTGGITGLIVGLVLIVYGRFYIQSALNPFGVTASDIMFAGLTVGLIGFATAFGISLYIKPQPAQPRRPSVRREDVGYWPTY